VRLIELRRLMDAEMDAHLGQLEDSAAG
jgi:hypothetical protein